MPTVVVAMVCVLRSCCAAAAVAAAIAAAATAAAAAGAIAVVAAAAARGCARAAPWRAAARLQFATRRFSLIFFCSCLATNWATTMNAIGVGGRQVSETSEASDTRALVAAASNARSLARSLRSLAIVSFVGIVVANPKQSLLGFSFCSRPKTRKAKI